MTTSMPAFLAHQLVSGQLEKPTIFKGMTDHWPCRFWNLNDWAKQFGSKKISFRIGEINPINVDPVWETDCSFIEGTITEFNSWLNNETEVASDSGFKGLNLETTWCYADYKYMAELFEDDAKILQAVNWDSFGFPGRNGKESSLWVGSKGSNTPCHYDTYGCNLVAQLYGKKRWILFPPWQADQLQPTRLPYEESSVFSKINIKNPQLDKYPTFKETTPYVICLEPGDVLFVPRHWWHFVESLETSIAINTWLELKEDDNCRLEESITKLLIGHLAPSLNVENWLNPTEEFTSPDNNLNLVHIALKNCIDKHAKNNLTTENLSLSKEEINETKARRKRHHQSSSKSIVTTCETSSTDVNFDQGTAPKQARAGDGCQERRMETTLDDTLQKYNSTLVPLQPVSFQHYLHLLNGCCTDSTMSSTISINPLLAPIFQKSNQSSDDEDEITTCFSKKLINCIVNPQVIKMIAELLKKDF